MLDVSIPASEYVKSGDKYYDIYFSIKFRLLRFMSVSEDELREAFVSLCNDLVKFDEVSQCIENGYRGEVVKFRRGLIKSITVEDVIEISEDEYFSMLNKLQEVKDGE